MSNIYKRAPFGNKIFESSSAGIDQEFFETHPDKNRYWRKVVRDEATGSLRKKRVHAVQVCRIANGIWLRVFVDAGGRVVDKTLCIDDVANRQEAQFCQNLFAALLSLKPTRGE